MIQLSVIVPAYRNRLLIPTVISLLQNSDLGDKLEVIVVFDGYWPNKEKNEGDIASFQNDPRIRYVHLGRNRGMREAINAGVRVSRGTFIMRADDHCAFGKGYDKILIESCEPNWIVTARRYYLDTDYWEVMDIEPVDCEKLVIQDGKKFAGQKWASRSKELENESIIESMAMQGSMWVMPRKWWDDVIGELQTGGYGPLIQDSHEMVFKTWKAGGKLMVNKKAWFAHRHRDYGRTHNNGTAENPANQDAGYKYALDVWGEYYRNEICPKWGI